MKTEIFATKLDFLKRKDKSVNGVSPSFAEENPTFESDNENNEGCWNCSGCWNCFDCFDCVNCSHCSDCFDCSHCFDCSDCFGSERNF